MFAECYRIYNKFTRIRQGRTIDAHTQWLVARLRQIEKEATDAFAPVAVAGEAACKPNSVLDNHSSGASISEGLKRHTRKLKTGRLIFL